ncbi:response regulator transcription factor [Proteiniclasticum sp. C24MP]|uniref:response regulator transcription factor n=1 Tax=Proteiniclasticum sp. C24MP TaxID=3374101 RepID=UPI0037541BE0
MPEKILIIDDEQNLLEVVSDYLRKNGFEVFMADRGLKALEMFHEMEPDFLILDLNLPDMSGEEICREIRKTSDVPILMLTAKTSEDDKITGFSLGADDYLTKPFSPRELVVRVNAIIRRARSKGNLSEIYSFRNEDLILDNSRRTVRKRGEEISLTPNEYKILHTLVQYPDQVFTRSRIVSVALGFDFEGYDRTIDTHIKNIRHKIEDDMKNPTYILTVYGVGYKFMGDVK